MSHALCRERASPFCKIASRTRSRNARQLWLDSAHECRSFWKGKRGPPLSASEARMQDHVGNTAMMFAARYGHINIVKALMCYELGIKDRNGWTALLHAVDADQLECVKLLVGGEFSMCDNYQSLAIDYCKEGPVKDVLLNHYMCSLQT